MLPHEIPDRPWAKVGSDLFEIGAKNYLIISDYYSKFPEVIQIPDKTAHTVVKSMKSVFARSGTPNLVVSDGGPCYDSEPFRNFLSEWEFEHVRISPGYSQSNGQIENAVKSVKRLLKKAFKSGEDPYNSLLEFRNTPIDGTNGFAPSELLNGRLLRSRLPTSEVLLKPHVVPPMLNRLQARQLKQKFYYDQRAGREISQPALGQAVRFRNPKNQWEYGIVKSELPQPRSVVVENQHGKQYKRNRRHMYTTLEKAPIPEPTEIDVGPPEPQDLQTIPMQTGLPCLPDPTNAPPVGENSYEQVQVRQDVTTRSGRVSKGMTKLNMSVVKHPK
jgi:hypothetical protein